jgi:hypothetical protein
VHADVHNADQNPPNPTEKLKPSPIFKVTVKDTLKISSLGYAY